MAYKQENPDAATASLSLEKMPVKVFEDNKVRSKGVDLNDFPVEFNENDTEAEEPTPSAEELRKRFNDKVHAAHVGSNWTE